MTPERKMETALDRKHQSVCDNDGHRVDRRIFFGFQLGYRAWAQLVLPLRRRGCRGKLLEKPGKKTTMRGFLAQRWLRYDVGQLLSAECCGSRSLRGDEELKKRREKWSKINVEVAVPNTP